MRTRLMLPWLVIFWLFAVCSNAVAAPTVELVVNGVQHRGRSMAHNESICWLADRDGRLEQIALNDVSSFRKLSGEFRSATAMDVANQMRKELGRSFDVQVRADLVVCAPRGKAAAYADVLDDVSRRFSGYFSRRSVRLVNREFPLVVVVLASKQEFDAHCQQEGIAPSPLLQGYYHPHTNRVTLYDRPGDSSDGNRSSISEGSRNTAVHEAIHQLAYNSGLHSRIGENPRWVVEGLATMLETSALQPNVDGKPSSRVNRERLDWFREFQRSRRNWTIAEVVASEQAFFSAPTLDSYSESWALTFFLMETRRSDYVAYLKRIAERDPLSGEYTPQARLADFQACFGKDLKLLETRFLRFIDSLD